jgi:predicted nucleic acid-binding Zn ribbon protein
MSMQRLGELLPGVLRELGLERDLAGWQAVQIWPEAVGEAIARRTRATSYHDGALMIEVEGSAWRHELGYLERNLVHRVNERLGLALVKRLRFTITRGGIRR